jgi:trans-aconitate 2-methyltransferase
MWDSGEYQRFADERARPFFDMLARVGASDPATSSTSGAVRGT